MNDEQFHRALGRLDEGPVLPDPDLDQRLWTRIHAALVAEDVTVADETPAVPIDATRPVTRKRRGWGSGWLRAAAVVLAVVIVAALVAVLAGTRDGDEQVPVGPSPGFDGIAFLSGPAPGITGPSGLRLVRADGSGLTTLLAEPVHQASWSPDGTRLVFTCDGGTASVICVTDAHGRDLVRLTTVPDASSAWSPDGPGLDLQPAWSPDGQRIAFTSWRDGPEAAAEIFVMRSDGTDMVNVTNDPAVDTGPVWSPDGKRIAFGSSRDGGSLVVIDADGGSPRTLGPWANGVRWSPDGTRIVAAGSTASGEGPVVVVDVATGATTRLAEQGTQAAWSPDGTKVAFTLTDGTGPSRIAIVDAAGDAPARASEPGSWPTWSPDGTTIAFAADDGLRVMGADGSGSQLVVRDANVSQPVWSPVGG